MATKKKKTAQRVLRVGNNVLIRTVSFFLTGEIVAMVDGFVVLRQAAWIADTGRFADALRTGELNEVEPVTTKDTLAEVSVGAIVDAFTWDHALPRAVK